MSYLITLVFGIGIGCALWAYIGTRIMLFVKGEVAVANDLRMKATVIENSLRAKI